MSKRLLLLYLLLLLVAGALFAALAWTGEQLYSGPTTSMPAAPHAFDTVVHVLLAMAVVIVTARLGALFHYLHQPPVTGEVVGGILLGPSVLGAISPAPYAALLPSDAAPFLGVIAQLGVILSVFIVGLHFDLRVIRTSGHATLAISHASIVVPFLLGGSLALGLYREFAPAGVAFIPSHSSLAWRYLSLRFPSWREFSDKNLHRTELGMLALTCAAIDDVTAWFLEGG